MNSVSSIVCNMRRQCGDETVNRTSKFIHHRYRLLCKHANNNTFLDQVTSTNSCDGNPVLEEWNPYMYWMVFLQCNVDRYLIIVQSYSHAKLVPISVVPIRISCSCHTNKKSRAYNEIIAVRSPICGNQRSPHWLPSPQRSILLTWSS